MRPYREQTPMERFTLKLKRAETHLNTIDEYVRAYESLHPYSIVSDLNDDKTFYECRVIATHPPFLDFGILVGEVAYQLRSTLDHIIFALSIFPAGLSDRALNRAHRATTFPIMLERDANYLGRCLTYVPSGIRDDIEQIVESLQPYHPYPGKNRKEDHLLVLLDDINVSDKHRIVTPTTGLISVPTDLPPGIEVMIRGSSVNTRDVIARIPANLNPQTDFYPRLAFDIVLPVRRGGGTVLLSELHRIHGFVREVIIPKFERFF